MLAYLASLACHYLKTKIAQSAKKGPSQNICNMEDLTGSVKDAASSVTKKLASKAIDHIRGFSDEYLEDQMSKGKTVEGSKRMTLMALLSSVAQLGMETINDGDGNNGNSPYSNEKQDHFTDKLINKLVSKLSKSKDKQELRQKLADVRRSQKPRLSLVKTTENFKNLSYRVSYLIDLQRQIVSIIKWDQKWRTMTYMFLYTWACIHPYLLLVYPIVFFYGTVMIPGYLDRHFSSKPEMLPEKPREPDSAFDFLKVTNDESAAAIENERAASVREEMFERKLIEHGYYGGSDITSPLSSAVTSENEDSSVHQEGEFYSVVADSTANNVFLVSGGAKGAKSVENTEKSTDEVDMVPNSASGEKTGRFIKNLSLLINMRDLQNLTSDMVRILDDCDLFVKDNCTFSDEETTTILFYRMLLLVVTICAFGAWVPWCAVFIFAGWGFVLWNHPARATFMEFVRDKSSKTSKDRSNGVSGKSSAGRKGLLDNIIVNEPAVQKEVTIFEIQKQDLADIKLYHPFIYSNSPFTISSSSRVRRKRPVGCSDLNMVKPPSRKWKFSSGSQWKAEKETPLGWISQFGLESELSGNDEDDGWAYDYNGEYRRRRLVRSVCWNPA